MLSKEQQVESDLWKYRNGMVNVAWLVGVARNVTKRGGDLQQTNNLNHTIPFHLNEGDSMPSRVSDRATIKVVGRLGGEKVGDDYSVVLRVLSFHTPSVIDLPPRRFWNQVLRPGIPQDDVRPDTYAEESVQALTGGRINEGSSNTVRVAGFVAAYRLQRAGAKKENGELSNGALLLLLRQTKDEKDLLPIMIYGRLAEAHANRIQIADALLIDGRLRVDAKPTGEPAGPDGIVPVKRRLYIQANTISSVDFGSEIKTVPDWAKDLYESVRKEPGRRPTGAAPRRGPTQPFSVQQASPSPDWKPPIERAGSGPVDAELSNEQQLLDGVDPSILQSFGR
ncbi:hypothetical protein [Cupriavidus malaysiensis]|uniref:Single-stranded DNA-binding protein n=1 Tax=Cupriavidus malaysiensis TaxID=367825 RepID=A0ABN4U0K4_9BURK|nr:hypothetical protein [Cupriavidus malaysiensis]AOZ11176.1 hypothetical protein BKK80_35070 [Cupriavidus malaysiensis]